MTLRPPPDTAPEAQAPTGTRREHAPKVMWNTGILAVSGMTVRALGLGMVMLLARYLGAEGYGTYQRAESTSSSPAKSRAAAHASPSTSPGW